MRNFAAVVLISSLGWAESSGDRVQFVGGTVTNIKNHSEGRVFTTSDELLRFKAKDGVMEVPYDKINLLEYGQKVDRRYIMAAVISPLFLMSKKRNHFLTIGYEDENGKQQAMVFRVQKGDVRSLLVSLEARTGRKVQFQDDEARRAGKG